MIAKTLIKILNNKDPRRIQYNLEVERINADLAALADKPAWAVKHYKGVDAVLTFSVFWAVLVGPLERIPKDERNKNQERLIRKFYDFMKKAGIKNETVQMPIGTSIQDRLKAMEYLNTD